MRPKFGTRRTAFRPSDGILLGGYIWTNDLGTVFAAMRPADRLRAAIADGERLHPGYANEVGDGVAVSWAKIPFSSGCLVRVECGRPATARPGAQGGGRVRSSSPANT